MCVFGGRRGHDNDGICSHKKQLTIDDQRTMTAAIPSQQRDALDILTQLKNQTSKVNLEDRHPSFTNLRVELPTPVPAVHMQDATTEVPLDVQQRAATVPADNGPTPRFRTGTATKCMAQHAQRNYLSSRDLMKYITHIGTLLDGIGQLQLTMRGGISPRRHHIEALHTMYKRFQEDFEADMPVPSPGQSPSLTPNAYGTVSQSDYDNTWDTTPNQVRLIDATLPA